VDPTTRPVKQERRRFALEHNQAAADEVEKLLQVGFIKESHYHDWLANVVIVKKSNTKWRNVHGIHIFKQSMPER